MASGAALQTNLCKVSFAVYFIAMTDSSPLSRIVPDAAALKALAHPDRMRMLGLLRIEGPQTATTLAARTGLNSGATSYHLRTLARHGFIEEASDLGSRRDRWWRARHAVTSHVDDAPAGTEAADAAGAMLQALLVGHAQLAQAALERYGALPAAWRRASTASDATLWLTANEAEALTARLDALLLEARAAAEPLHGPAPEGARRFTVQIHAFPYPDSDPEEDAP